MEFVKWEDVKDQAPVSAEALATAQSAIESEFAGFVLRELRRQNGLSQAQLAVRMGLSQRRVSAIERGELDRSEVGTLRSYISALGGHVHVIASVGDQTIRIA